MMRMITVAICAWVALLDGSPRAGSTVTVLSVEGRSNATPWIAADGPFVAVAWGATAGGRSDVFAAVSRDGGRTFGAPVQVNADAGEGRLGGEMPPRIGLSRRRGTDPEIVVLWTSRGNVTAVKTARSRDGGKTFAKPVAMQAPGTPGDRGWPALAVDAAGTAHVAWLDHRGLASSGTAMNHADHKTAAPRDAVAMSRRSGLYYASAAPGTAPVEHELTSGVCYCCKTAMAARDGRVFTAWRQVYPGNLRDIAFSVSRDAGRSFSTPARVSEDKWALDGCPDDGPAMAVDARNVVHLVWPTVVGGTSGEGAIFYASSVDGQSFTRRVRVPTLGGPRPSHPQIVVDESGHVTVGWDELVGGERVAAVRALGTQRDGAISFGPIVKLADTGRATYPVMAAAAGGVVAAWTTGSPEASVVTVRRLQP
jgi:hypothetical protein